MSRARRITGGLAALALTPFVVLAGCSMPGDDPREVTYVLLPHPDDEFQVWSQIEGREDSATVFVLMTRGEESSYCDSETGGGRWSDTCESERLSSWVGFFEQMGESDETLPADFPDDPETVSGLDAGSARIGRDDDGSTTTGREALAWPDADGRGGLVAFDLGDGDLTAAEVEWAVEQVTEDPGRFGLDEQAPDRVLGAYTAPDDARDCFPYPHPDHAAVAEAITSTDLAEEQGYATCAATPGEGDVEESTVSDSAADAAFGEGGAFPEHYGWLGTWSLDRDRGQGELFHVHQAFRMVD